MSKGENLSENASEKSVNELKEILESYTPKGLTERTTSLLALHLYEIAEGCRRYITDYKAFFSSPKGLQGQEGVSDRLIRMKVLLEDVSYHIEELTREVGDFLEEFDEEK